MESVKPSSIKWKAQKEKRDLAFLLVSDFISVAIQIKERISSSQGVILNFSLTGSTQENIIIADQKRNLEEEVKKWKRQEIFLEKGKRT